MQTVSPPSLAAESATHDAPSACAVTDVTSLERLIEGRLRRTVYKTFAQQHDALAFVGANAHLSVVDERMPVFALDLADDAAAASRRGRKQYLLASHLRFLEMLRTQMPENRRWYEILRRDFFCKLFVDIDIDKRTNPLVDYAETARLLRARLCEFIDASYPDERGRYEFIELASSSERKFSLHWIVEFRDAAFQDHQHCGAFMRRFHRWLVERDGAPHLSRFFGWGRTRIEPPPTALELERLLVDENYNARKDWVSFVDMHIYTMHRAFRLYGSHKYGDSPQTRKLWLSSEVDARCAAELMSAAGSHIDERVFVSTLIQGFWRAPQRVLQCREWSGAEPCGTSSAWDHLYVPRNAAAAATSSLSRRINVVTRAPSDGDATTATASPVIDALSREMAQSHEGAARLYAPRLSVASGCLTFRSASHHCEIAQREHSSNFVYFVVNVPRGVWYQKCYSCHSGVSRHRRISDALAARCDAYWRAERDGAERVDVARVFGFLKHVALYAYPSFARTHTHAHLQSYPHWERSSSSSSSSSSLSSSSSSNTIGRNIDGGGGGGVDVATGRVDAFLAGVDAFLAGVDAGATPANVF